MHCPPFIYIRIVQINVTGKKYLVTSEVVGWNGMTKVEFFVLRLSRWSWTDCPFCQNFLNSFSWSSPLIKQCCHAYAIYNTYKLNKLFLAFFYLLANSLGFYKTRDFCLLYKLFTLCHRDFNWTGLPDEGTSIVDIQKLHRRFEEMQKAGKACWKNNEKTNTVKTLFDLSWVSVAVEIGTGTDI